MTDTDTTGIAGIGIRGYRAGDGDSLRALWVESGFRLTGDDDDGLERFSARNPGLFLVAEDAGRIVASAMGAWDGHRGWLYHVTTAVAYRRRGLATRLIGRIENGLRALDCPRSLVIVEADNQAALAFWAALGYELRDTHQLGKAL